MNEKDFQLIEKYFDNNLSSAEKAQFEEGLKQEAFRKEVALQKEIMDITKEAGIAFDEDVLEGIDIDYKDEEIRKNLQAQAKRLAGENTSTSKQKGKIKQIRPIRRILSIAAGIAILIGLGLLFFANNQYTDGALATTNYYTADVPGTMSNGDVENENFQKGMAAIIKDKDYNAGIEQLKNIPAESTKFIEAQYFLAHAYFNKKDHKNAILKFEQVVNADNLPAYINRDKLQWDYIMAKMGDGQNVNSDLDALIAKGQAPYAEKAKKLKQQLNSFWRKFTL